MSYIKIEPSGCGIYKGWIQVRLCFYLEPADPRYGEHHVFVVDETSQEFKDGYTGVVDAEGLPTDQSDYDTWVVSLPHIWRDNPFHNHFIFVDFNTPLTDIIKSAKEAFDEFLAGWKVGLDGNQVWHSRPRPKFVAKTLTAGQLALANMKLAQIKMMVIN